MSNKEEGRKVTRMAGREKWREVQKGGTIGR